VPAPPRLFLVDGSALAYRSHFAFIRNPLRNGQGLNTSAAFGFTRELLRILDEERPDLIAVVFDVAGKTFRHERFPAYKATREQMPSELVSCLPYIDRVVQALGIPLLGRPGVEADDVIGTLARQGRDADCDVFIVTADKDFCQLVGERVTVYNPWKTAAGGRIDLLTPQRVQERYGVAPAQFRDYLALVGDASDNVPGVPGVGKKRAAEILEQFGSLEAALAGAADYKRKAVREKLVAHADDARLSYELVTIDTDVPLEETHADLLRGEADRSALAELFAELEFKAFLRRFSVDLHDDPHVHHRVTDVDDLVERLKTCERFVFDLETTSLDPKEADIVGLAVSFSPGEAWYLGAEERLGTSAFELFPMELDFSAHLEKLKPVLEDPDRPKGGQNVKYDIQVLARHGVQVRGVAFDTLLESYLLDPSAQTHGLDDLATRYLGYRKIATSDVLGKGKKRNMRDTPDEEIFPYASEDADITLRLHQRFSRRLAGEPSLERLYREVELPLLWVLLDMEQTGVRVDTDALAAIRAEFEGRLQTMEREIQAETGEVFNLGSPKQVGAVLFDKLRLHEAAGMRLRKTATGAISTSHDVLLELSETQPIAGKILEHRQLEKLLGTYVKALPELVDPKTGRVHTHFNQAVTATGRLSSSDPNLQNIPIRTAEGRRIRSAFVPGEPGWVLLSADYSQVELRVLAHLSGDPSLIEAFRSGHDIHAATAARVSDVPLEEVTPEQRGRAKAINFGIVYGMGPQRLANDTGMTLDEARAFIANYFEKYPEIKGYLDGQVAQARREGYVETILGRRRPLVDIRANQRLARSNAERMALNTPIQGSAADLIKVAMVRLHRRLRESGLKARMLLQVHDELVFECPAGEADALEALVREEMEGAYPLAVPLAVDVGRGANWLEAH
jgi:DNA polymerase-1